MTNPHRAKPGSRLSHTAVATALTLLIASCSGFVQPTATPVPTATVTATAVPTQKPTARPTPTVQVPTAVALPSPSGKPLSEWEGIPIMPGALGGEAKAGAYSFTVHATPDEILAFYKGALTKLGWKLMATGQGKAGPVMLIFIKDSATVSVVLTAQDSGVIMVMLVK